MVLTGLVVFVTWFIVTNDKRKARKRKMKNFEEAKSTIESTKNIKTIWGIEDIRDGIIYLKNNKYAAAVKIGSLDVGLLSNAEQETVENALFQLGLSLKSSVRFHSTTDYVDTTQTQLAIQKALINESFPLKMRTYAEGMIKYLEDMRKTRNVYTRKDYAVLFYEGELEKAYNELERQCQVVISSLRKANVTAERVNSEEELNVIHNSLNKRSLAKPSNIVKQGAFELYVSGSRKVLKKTNENTV